MATSISKVGIVFGDSMRHLFVNRRIDVFMDRVPCVGEVISFDSDTRMTDNDISCVVKEVTWKMNILTDALVTLDIAIVRVELNGA